MKKGVWENREKFNIRKTIPFKILIICIILLIILVLIWVVFKINEREEEKKLGGELGTLKWDFNQEKVVLSVLNYTIYNDNQTIDVNINWSSGNRAINAIFVKFLGVGTGCNYTQTNDLVFGENKTYSINCASLVIDFGCTENSLDNVTGVEAFAQIHINLTQGGLIPNITFYKDDSRQNLINLNQYFSSLVNVNYGVVESPINDKIEIVINNTNKNISISILDATWFGTQKFNLTAISDDGDVLNTVNSGENMSFYIVVVNANRPISNKVPEFISENCSSFIIDLKTIRNLKINMKDCFKDEDNNNLSFRFDNSSMKNISISRDSNNLTLTPRAGFIGKEYLTLYANDSINEEDGRVYVNVTNSSVVNATTPTPLKDPKIISSSPSGTEIYMFPGNKTFSITAGDYTSIKWYLNGGIVTAAESKLSYEFSNLKEGDIIKVDVINGTKVDSKTWNIKIQGNDEGEEPVFDIGAVIFYAIIAVLGIIIILVVWLFFIEKNKKSNEMGIGFGVSGSEGNVRINSGKSSLDDFNIPE